MTPADSTMILRPYRNADETTDIGALAERRLQESPYFYLKRLRCRYEAGVLTLLGRVPYGQLKQIAESIVERVEGIEHVINRVEVLDPTGVPAVRNAG